MTPIGCVLAIAVSGLPALDKPPPPYVPVVEILKIDVSPVPGKAKRHKLDILFNLAPEAAKGIKVSFELQRDGNKIVMKWAGGNPIEQFQFTLENEVRKGLKVSILPDERLVSGEYFIVTSTALTDQSPEVRKVIEGKPQRFPVDGHPWPTAHEKQKFTLGNAEEQAAELAEMKNFAEANVDGFLELNNEAMERFEAAAEDPKMDTAALKKFLEDWMKRMAAAQSKVNKFLDEERGLCVIFPKAHFEVQEIGRMIAKRITKTELGNLLKKKNLAPASVRPANVAGSVCDANYRYTPSAAAIEKRYNDLLRLVDPKGEVPAASPDDPDAEKAAGDEKDAGAEDPAGKEEEKPREKEEKATPKEKEEKAPKKSGSGAKDGAKETKKKSKK